MEVDATNCKGLYRFDLSDAAIASGAFTIISLEFDGIIEESVEIPLHNRKVDVVEWLGTAAAAPTVAGVPEVDVTHMAGGTQTVTDLKDFADAGYDPATKKVQGVVLVDTVTTLTGHTAQTADHTAGIADIPTVAEFNARTLAAASYFDPAADTVALVTDLTTKTGFSLSTAGILAIWHQALTAVVTAGSVGKLLKDEITSARMATLTDWINGGRLDLLLDAIPTTAMRGTDNAATEAKQDTMQTALDTVTKVGPTKAEMDTAHGLLATPAQVNTEVSDVLKTDTVTLPGQGAPTVTPTIETILGYLYKQWRNRKNQTATTQQLFADDATTVDQKATVSDDATVFTKGEVGTGA